MSVSKRVLPHTGTIPRSKNDSYLIQSEADIFRRLFGMRNATTLHIFSSQLCPTTTVAYEVGAVPRRSSMEDRYLRSLQGPRS